jgi:2-iminoacetate synthase ThiH
VKVKTLARALGLPEDADQEACFAEIRRRKQTSPQSSREEAKVAVARLQAKLGVSQTEEYMRPLLAEEIHDNLFCLRGKWLTREELQVEAEKQWEADHELDGLERDLGLDKEPVQGEEIHVAAMEDLHARGVYEPSQEQYLAACKRAGAS